MTLSHDVAGDGPAVVLLHSGVCDRRMWDPQWAALTAAGRTVVRCDLRGFGESPAADKPCDDADDVRDLLDTLGVERAVVVGSSFGGAVALEVAARWPDRVTGLLLLCAASPVRQEKSPEFRAVLDREDALIEGGDVAGAVELMVDTWVGPEAGDTVREAVRVMQRRAYELQLAAAEVPSLEVDFDIAAAKAPCLAVSGAHDLPDFRRIAARLPDLLPDARHVELPWAGHLPSMERPAEVTRMMLDFLRDPRAAV
ncbi:alpha/beta fold hydrolase [Actinacidiphila acidipaludis]|uniref:Alpha/beta hydrolase n=1 Tax=Actinacidiphila acidipaludis TaxID=2873382 RepID=A0ABS7Q1S4_9ACTN|nr:alpha/beta hydrolase [Streptomyces acidipaludis]MBY8877087.1 alpha/beta hydrolase [Streptomyces acidipaludis]